MFSVTRDTSHDKSLNLADLRDALGLTQERLAAKIGKPRTMVQGWESGKNRPGKTNRALLAKALGVEPEDLGPAWNPESPRKKRGIGRKLDTSAETPHTGVAHLLHSGTPPYPLGGTLMPDAHDPALFQEFAGLWMAISHDERVACLHMAETFIHDRVAKRSRKAKNK